MFPRGVEDGVMFAVVVALAETGRGDKDGGARDASVEGDEAISVGDVGDSGGLRGSVIVTRVVREEYVLGVGGRVAA